MLPEPGIGEHLRGLCRERNPAGLRACYPRDICDILVARPRYRKRPISLSRRKISLAVDGYSTQMPNAAGQPK